VLSFAPLVRSKLQDKAARYGATVEVDQVVPSWKGVSLRGVEVTVEDMPGVRVWLDEVVVDWNRRPVSTSGGKIVAVGAMSTLMANFETWKEAHLKGGGGGGTSRKLAIEDFAVEWQSAPTGATQSVHAAGVSASKEGGVIKAAAGQLSATHGDAEVEVTGGAIELVRSDGAYRLAALKTKSLSVAYELGVRPHLVAHGEAPAPVEDGPTADIKEDVEKKEGEAAPAGPHPRVLAARRARRWAMALAERLDGMLDADAEIALEGTSARLGMGDEVLNLGPGTLSIAREQGDLAVSLAPSAIVDGGAKAGDKPLTFSARIPYAPGGEGQAPGERPMRLEVHGGPVFLSMLGVREGDMGLRHVADTRIEADVVVVLPPGEQTLSIDGRGRVEKLSILDERLAKEPLENVQLAWKSKLDARLDGTKLTLNDVEVDLGDIRFLLKGTWERRGGEHVVAVDYTIPLMTCERAFGSIPEALVPKLKGMHFAGSLSMKGHARFDTANIKKDYDVDWDGTLSCRITHAPKEVVVTRFKNSFTKVVYTPKGEERNMTFGPNEKTWVPLASISHFMSGSVLVTEDGRFYRHRGFDKEAIVNSLQQNIEARRFVRGASTISMQLAKNLYLHRTKTLSRKLQEAVLTMYLEQELTKREMMELYLNIIEYGPMVYGIGPAARHYFNSHPSRLSVSQSMYLASILRNPKKQYFGAGGAVIASHMRTLRLYMKILEKIGRIDEDELARGLRETVVFGSPAPIVAPAEDEDGYPLDEEPTGAVDDSPPGEPTGDPMAGPTHEANAGF
jgi:hypothetical protein